MKFIPAQKRIRLPSYDYTNGWFFITNKTDFSQPYLKGIIHDIVKTEIENISAISHGADLDYAIIVPTHVHCIITLIDAQLTLSEVWRRFKARTTYYARRNGFAGRSLWQKNYYEHVIRNDTALDRIREYIRNNPLKENLPFNEIYGDEMKRVKNVVA